MRDIELEGGGRGRQYLAVKNYERFQHYKDRSPPWIKLYNSLLDDYAFLRLPERTQRDLILIWLIASRHGNRIPNDPVYIRRAIHARTPVDLEALIGAGFLIELVQDANTPPAAPYQGASGNGREPEQDASSRAPPRAREREKRIETENKPPSTSEARARVYRHLGHAYEEELAALEAAAPNSVVVFAEICGLHDGLHGRSYGWDEIGIGIRDFVANGKHKHFSLRQFRRYVAGSRELTPHPTPARRPSAAEQSLLNSAIALKDIVT